MSLGFAPWPQAALEQSNEQCYIPTVPSQGGVYTTYTISCAHHPLSPPPSSPTDRKALSPTLSHSGSSAGNSSIDREEELIVETSEINPQYTAEFSEEPSHIEYRSLLDAPPIYSLGSSIGYGIARVIFIEKLICESQLIGRHLLDAFQGTAQIRSMAFTAYRPHENQGRRLRSLWKHWYIAVSSMVSATRLSSYQSWPQSKKDPDRWPTKLT